MAYALRYYKELIHEDGSAHRLEIHKKDSTAEAVEIGAVIQGLALEIQGSQGDVDSPIVKTSLSMTFVDAGDIEDGRKNGFWQEFYTPDALLWKVILKARTATETSFRTMWGGYVTPDSFSESLVYRGSVNIIARDNLGHMQDFPFDAVGDADGLISLRNLVEAGWEKIRSPMVLDWRGEAESNMWLMCDGVPAPDTLMNVSQFEGMDWYKAIETALASYGIVMRYVGDNIVNVSSLRSMPLQGREVMDNLSQITPVFVAGAQRELVPAVRRIEESVSYDLQETLSMPKLDSSAFTGDTQSYRCKIDGVDIGYGQFGTLEHDAPIWPINPNNGWSDEDDATTLFFNPKAYELGTFASRRGLGDEIYRYMYIAANNVDDRRVSFTRSITCADVTISMKLGQPCNLDILSRIEQQSVFNLKRITFAVILEQGGVTRYYNGRSWGASYAEISVDYDPTSPSYEFSQFVSMDDNAGAAELTFCIVKIEYAQTSYVGNSSVYGLYACIQDLSFNIPESSSLLSDNSVNTVYNSENNVILSRTPEIGPAYNAVALPGLIKNGIFYRSEGVILPARAWGWSGSTPQQMAVYNHLQLLCYYAKPNNLISGTIVNGDLTSGRAIYLWHGKEHLLVSGRYNLLNGMIEGAMLREFTRYEAMWGEVSETAFPDTEQDSTTNVEGGASSGGSSSTYTNTTTVNIGSGGGGGASYLNDLLDVNTDSVTAQSVLYYNGMEWVGRSLSTILNGYAKSADLLTLSKLLASMWSIDADGNLVTDKQVIIKNNLIVKGDTASGGTGGGAAIGVTGILVDGKQYTDNDSDGYIDLSEAFAGLSPTITSAMITEALGYTPADSASLGSLASKDSLVASDIPDLSGKYLSTAGGTISAAVVSPLKLNIKGSNAIYLTFSQNDEAKAYVGYNPSIGAFLLGPYGALALNSEGASLYGNTIYHSGNFNPANYLPKAGGTITSSSHIPLVVESTASNNYVAIRLKSASTQRTLGIKSDGTLFVTNVGGWDSEYPILHSGNVAEYALKLDGSNITPTTIDANNNLNDYRHGYVTYKDAKNPTNSYGNNAVVMALAGAKYSVTFQLAFDGNNDRLGYRRKSIQDTWSDWKTIAFTDSDITGKSGDSDKLGGIKADHTFQFRGSVNKIGGPDGAANLLKAGSYVIDTDYTGAPAKTYGTLLQFLGGESWVSQFAMYGHSGQNPAIYYRRSTNGNASGFTAWKLLAFTDSNVASAQALKHSNGTVGATVANTGRVDFSGNIALALGKSILDPSGRSIFMLDDNNSPQIGYDTVGSYGTYINGKYVYLRYGSSRTAGLILNSSGNVLIGTTTDAGYKLDVNGTGRFTGAVTMASTLEVTGHTTINGSAYLKGGVEVYGSTPYIDFHFGNATDDYTSRIIEIALGNLAVYANWLPNTNNAKKLGNSDKRWSEIFGVNGNLSGTLNVGGTSTFNGDVRINGNLVVTGDTASGGTGESTTEDSGVLTWEQEPPTGTGLTVTDLSNVGITSQMLSSLVKGAYHHVIIKESTTAHKLYSVSGRSAGATNYQITLISGLPDDSNYSVYTIRRVPTGWNITKI